MGGKSFQVDVILVPIEEFPMHRFLLGNGDFGMLLGNLCSLHGLKLGGTGLRSVVWCPETQQNIGNIIFEQYDVVKICDFLGLNLDRFKNHPRKNDQDSGNSDLDSDALLVANAIPYYP